MKTSILSFLFVIAIFSPTCKCKQDPVQSDGRLKYAKDILPLDYKPDQFKTYTLVPPPALNAEFLQKESERIFSLTGAKGLKFIADTALSSRSQYLSLRRSDDPSGVFEIHRITGRVFYNRGLKSYKTDLATQGLPDESGAIKLSQSLIEQLQIGADIKELSKPDVSFLEMSTKKDQDPTQTFRKMVTVRYDRVLDGLPVEGDTRLIFSFGQSAELTSMVLDWGKWEGRTVAPEAVIAAKEMERGIEQKILKEAGAGKEIIVEKRYPVLYNDGQGKMEPAVYVRARFSYVRKSPDGREATFSIPYDFYEPILKQPGALFPHLKDRQLDNRPLQVLPEQRDSVRRNRRTKDE